MDEENIVRRMINGDMDAFGELMEKYERPALRAAWLISGNAADSEDIVQETFTACYLNRKKLRQPLRHGFTGYSQGPRGRSAESRGKNSRRRNLHPGRRTPEGPSWKTAL